MLILVVLFAVLVPDAFGNRVSKSVNGVTTKYLVEDDVNPTGLPQVLEETVNGVVQRTYTYGLQRISESQMVSGTWTTSFYGHDGAGSVRQLTNSAGVVTDEYEYDAFGNSFTKTGTTPNNYLYRGEQYDSDLGLYYLRARYYNSATGRFMSRDPYDGNQFGPKTLHKYLYTAGDPVNRIDPRGRLFEYVIESSAAIPEARLIDIYGCVADAALTAVSLILDPNISTSTELGGGAAIIGCVTLAPGLSELAEEGNLVVKRVQFVGKVLDWGSCALGAKDFVDNLNDELLGTASAVQITDSITALTGCVGNALGAMLEHPGASLLSLGL
jgi:RHS repeat-associated protein